MDCEVQGGYCLVNVLVHLGLGWLCDVGSQHLGMDVERVCGLESEEMGNRRKEMSGDE